MSFFLTVLRQSTRGDWLSCSNCFHVKSSSSAFMISFFFWWFWVCSSGRSLVFLLFGIGVRVVVERFVCIDWGIWCSCASNMLERLGYVVLIIGVCSCDRRIFNSPWTLVLVGVSWCWFPWAGGNFCGKALFVTRVLPTYLTRNTPLCRGLQPATEYIHSNLEAADRLLICKSNVDNLL